MATCMNQSVNPATVGIFMYIQIFYAYAFDVMIFEQEFMPLQLVGSSIVLVFSVLTAIHKKRTSEQENLKQAEVAESTVNFKNEEAKVNESL